MDIGKLDARMAERLGHLREKAIKNPRIKLNKGMVIKLSCDYCEGSVDGKPHLLKFGNFERFFCCTSCRSLYKEKYKARIVALDQVGN